jgi:hypothetical protein
LSGRGSMRGSEQRKLAFYLRTTSTLREAK